jgi:hypothetical protein
LVSEEVGEPHPDDTPDAIILERLRESLPKARNGQILLLAQIWDGINVEYSTL